GVWVSRLMRGRGGWPAPCAQSISWRRLRVDNAAGVAANGALLFRADFGLAAMLSALPVFWRSLVGKSFRISSVRLPACSLSDASFSRSVHSRYWKTYPSFLFCNPAPAVISVRSCGKAGSHSFLRTSDRVLDQPGGGMASNTG